MVDAGFDVLDAVEKDAAAVATYTANHGSRPSLAIDIAEVDADEAREHLQLAPGRLDLLNACPPCQGWSTLGNGQADDARNDLVAEIWRFVRAFRPRMFLIENVPGLRADARLSRLVRRCRAIGYGVRPYLLDAADCGVPQKRLRLIVVGVRHRRASSFPESILDVLPKEVRDLRPTAGEAIAEAGPIDASVDPIHRSRSHSANALERIRAVPAGGTRFDLPNDLWLECHRKLKSRRATASYGRMRSDTPAPTLTTRCTTPACGSFIHPTEDRGITLREAALIQTFPRTYKFRGAYGEVEAQIGNAMPPRMTGAAVAAVLRLASGC